MKVHEAIKQIQSIQYAVNMPEVVRTAALELNPNVEKKACDIADAGPGVFQIAVGCPGFLDCLEGDKEDFIYFRISKDGSGLLIATKAYYLYSFVCHLKDRLRDQDQGEYEKGKKISPAFLWQRISYDYFLTQAGRIQHGLDRESYVKELARLGFTHVEINGLASPMGLESGPKGETYPMFYTYCPALDQFVYSELNKGIYPFYYLSANMAYMKENADLALKYGLSPGMLCFEPRSVPEQFFDRYPMLRGARVDHPFRSFKPRYNMTITHPKVLDHYQEMLSKVMEKIPELSFINIWTNDSGAGFEHTKSLYVGRNGGAYLIREWRDDESIAELAGENALRFFRTLRDGGAKVNPEFRVILRMESFYGEHHTIWKGLGDRLDVETTSLAAKGWDMPYTHPRYPESRSVNGGTVHQNRFDEKEKPPMEALKKQGARAHFYFAAGPHILFEPLLGTPYPFLTYERLKVLKEGGVAHLAHSGGTQPKGQAPYNINHEICRLFQYNPKMDVEEEVLTLALRWAGPDHSQALVQAWKQVEEAILCFPNVTPMYSAYGFTWYRLWVRPLVPNMEAVPEQDRAFYEDHMCTTPHNPNNIDLSRDVLFRLIDPDKAKGDVEKMDAHVFEPMDHAIGTLAPLDGNPVIHDQVHRFKALRCWFMTQRNVAAWVAGQYGYKDAKTEGEKAQNQRRIKELIAKEIENARALRELLSSDVEIMATTSLGENPLIHGRNLKDLLGRRIQLMEKHQNDTPHMDPDYIQRKAGRRLG